jgi:hypothetical protein
VRQDRPVTNNLVAEIHHFCSKTTSQHHAHWIIPSQLSDIAAITPPSQLERLALAVLLAVVD